MDLREHSYNQWLGWQERGWQGNWLAHPHQQVDCWGLTEHGERGEGLGRVLRCEVNWSRGRGGQASDVCSGVKLTAAEGEGKARTYAQG